MKILLTEIKKARSYEDCQNLWSKYVTSQMWRVTNLDTLQEFEQKDQTRKFIGHYNG